MSQANQGLPVVFEDKVNRRDLVINFRKPKPGERTAHIVIDGTEDETTFNEKSGLLSGSISLPILALPKIASMTKW